LVKHANHSLGWKIVTDETGEHGETRKIDEIDDLRDS
jgi:hypothetical protein